MTENGDIQGIFSNFPLQLTLPAIRRSELFRSCSRPGT